MSSHDDDDDDGRFDEAVASLYSPLHQAHTPEALQRSAQRRTRTIQDMRTYMKRVQLDFPPDKPLIHVTGTKGKGSTVSMCECVLREKYQKSTGLFTSPHLVDIRERIRVNGNPVSKRVFGQAYWTLHERLQASSEEKEKDDGDLPTFPGYFRMMTLMALYIFANYEPTIDVVLMEVGMGGRYDATNLFDLDTRPAVCGVTLLDLDHTRVLGTTLEQIAWEKGGIFKIHKDRDLAKRPTESHFTKDEAPPKERKTTKSPPYFYALGTNSESVLHVLGDCAAIEGLGRALQVVPKPGQQLLPSNLKLGLAGSHQRANAELAMVLCHELMNQITVLEDRGIEATFRALESVSWPGRCQTVPTEWPIGAVKDATRLRVCLDGAHTLVSLEAGLSWFLSQCPVTGDENPPPVLIFNCSHERDPVQLLHLLVSAGCFGSVYFCRADFERPSMVGKPTARELLQKAGLKMEQTESCDEPKENLTWQDTLGDIWTHLQSDKPLRSCTSGVTVRQALDDIHKQAADKQNEVQVYVTGSLYLVGSALEAIEWSEVDAPGRLKRSILV